MFRGIITGFLFMVILMIQVSFIHSLPTFLSIIPIMFALSVYLVQHQQLQSGALWLIVYGMYLDMFGLGEVPFITLAFTAAAIVCVILSRRLFTNRSIYGVLGNGLITATSFITVVIGIRFLQDLRVASFLDWNTLLNQELIFLGLLLLVLIGLFQSAGLIRFILIKSFLLSPKQQTY